MAWFAFAAGWLARRRDRLVTLWAIYGAVLGPVALVLLQVAPHGHCQTCHMPTQGWVTTCPWCHENVNTVPSTARRAAGRTAAHGTPRVEAATATRVPGAASTPAALRGGEVVPQITPSLEPPTNGSTPRGAEIPSWARTQAPETVAPVDRHPPAFKLSAPRATPPESADRFAGAPRARAARGDNVEPGHETRVLATATYVTGTARLEPGQRYGIAIRGSRFLVVGPVDLDSKRVALDRPVADIQVSGLEGRLVVSEQGGAGVVLAFMSVAGAGLGDLAGAIRSAARNAES